MKIDILVFAKAPIPGYSKTRLIPVLGADGAALLQQKMTEQIVQHSVISDLGAVSLYCVPDGSHHSFTKLQREYPLTLKIQQGDDLGERMSRAIRSELEGSDAVILVGSDCPQLDSTILCGVGSELRQSDVVIVPAVDGGYVLIAMRQSASTHLEAIFGGIEWGSSKVLAQTEKRLSDTGLGWYKFPELRDVDREEDLEYLPPHLFENGV